jgi:hypothetical protein
MGKKTNNRTKSFFLHGLRIRISLQPHIENFQFFKTRKFLKVFFLLEAFFALLDPNIMHCYSIDSIEYGFGSGGHYSFSLSMHLHLPKALH